MGEIFFAAHGFPMVYPLNSTGTAVEGLITVSDEDFFIRLCVEGDKPPWKVDVRGSWKLFCYLKPIADDLERRLSLCNKVPDMLQEVKSILEQKIKQKFSSNADKYSVEYYEAMYKHVQLLGNQRICYTDQDLKVMQLKAYDECNREHILHMNFPPSFPVDGPTLMSDLPEEFSFAWSPGKTLLDVYNQFEDSLSKYGLFWRYMSEIDENTWVLGPENITAATCKRRIAVAPMASLIITVSPSFPSGVPTCQYMGPEEVVQPLRETFDKNINKWDEALSLLFNLRRVFNTEFPSPSSSDKQDFCIECSICFSYKLGDAIPDVICSNRCRQPFHQICLYEWLKVCKTAIQTSSKIGGDCPSCGESIWCSLPELDAEKCKDMALE